MCNKIVGLIIKLLSVLMWDYVLPEAFSILSTHHTNVFFLHQVVLPGLIRASCWLKLQPCFDGTLRKQH